jgi:hypothetical protein
VFARTTPQCTHLDEIRDVTPSAQGCEECLQMGDTWVHLRECLICGHVGCCDASVSLQRRNALSFQATLSPDGEVSALTLATVA